VELTAIDGWRGGSEHVAPAPAEPSIALVHDYLNQRGGAERVVLAMAEIWPEAPIYTSLYRERSTFEAFAGREVRTSWLQKLPVDRRFRSLLPLYPSAMSSLGTIGADVVLSSSSGWAHAVRTAPHSKHVVYCHAPARWLYSEDEYFHEQGARRRLVNGMLGPLRRWDQAAARRPDRYVANAHNVARRIKAAYGIDADVVHPPVDVDRFTPRPRGDRLLVVSRLLSYKRIDLVVQAANRLGMGLDVVGAGPDLDRLRALAGPTVTFHGRLSDDAVTELMETCNAFCFPGREDFGIAPVEALAAGKPVVAFGAGGALETLEAGYTAALFGRQEVDQVVRAIRRVQAITTAPAAVAETAERFSPRAFERGLRAVVDDVLVPDRAPVYPLAA
jgi:glycosyltransferase involved in cell wall biosynthesis